MTATKRPWWELTQTPASDLIMGALFAVLAAVHWMALATGDDARAWTITAGVVETLAAIGYLSSATVRLRRKRRDTL